MATATLMNERVALGDYDVDRSEEHVMPMDEPVIVLLATQAATIAGGTTEVQKNIIGERLLGLPREPGIDPNTPWSRIPRS